MREAVERLGLQPDFERQFDDPLLKRTAARDMIVDKRLGDDVAHAKARVQRRIGILKDHLQAAAIGTQLAARQMVNTLAPKADLAGRRFDQFKDRLAGGRFAATRLTDQPEGLARCPVERNAVDRPHLADDLPQDPAAHREVFDKTLDRQQRGGGAHRASRSEWKQAAKWPGAFSSKPGISRRQRALT